MIYQPKNAQPSYLSIDGTEDNLFTMEVNTNNLINGYKLTILNWDNSVFYSGSKVTLTDYVYNGDILIINVPSTIGLNNGLNYKWYVQLYQPTANMKITYGTVQNNGTDTTIYIKNNINIKSGMILNIGNESKEILSYTINDSLGYAEVVVASAFTSSPILGDEYNIYSDFIQTVPEYIVYVRSNPITTISNFIPSITKKFYDFIGNYEQSDNVPIIYHKWDLYLIENNGDSTLIKTSGKVYSANLRFNYDGFKNGQTYNIVLSVENEFGIISTSGIQEFTVSYDTIEYLQEPNASLIKNKNSIQVSWSSPVTFSPMVYDYKMNVGQVKEGDITGNSLYIETGLDITPNLDFITINKTKIDYISSYDSNTGLLVGQHSRFEGVSVGDNYFVSHYLTDSIDPNLKLLNNPYNNTNSVQLDNRSLSYNNLLENGSIGEMPSDFHITSQFKPNEQLFFEGENIYKSLLFLSSILTSEADIFNGSIIIFAHNYNIGAMWAQTNESGVLYRNLPIATNTAKEIHLGVDIDLSETSYIMFENGHVEYIDSFDHVNFIATLENELSFIPEGGDTFVLMISKEAPFYTNVNEKWALQLNSSPSSDSDYIWNDNNYWASENEGSYYWVEGGGATVRIAQNWWKLDLTKDTIKIEKGGI